MVEIRMEQPAKNALGSEMIAWLTGQLEAAGEEPVLLTGTADAFSAGLNLKEVASLDGEAMVAYLRAIDGLARRLFEHPAPTVACINGHAIAGGCVLALCCDHRVCTANPRTRIGLNEVALGVCFPPLILRICQYRLRRHAERTMLGAALFPPDEALALGLVDEVTEDFEGLARQRLDELARLPARSYALTKKALQGDCLSVPPEVERQFLDEELPEWCSAEVKERVLAVLAR